jgi:hypothetical protein
VQALEVDPRLGMSDDQERRPFLSLTKRFFEWPPGISSLRAWDSATVKTGTCS